MHFNQADNLIFGDLKSKNIHSDILYSSDFTEIESVAMK